MHYNYTAILVTIILCATFKLRGLHPVINEGIFKLHLLSTWIMIMQKQRDDNDVHVL